MVLGVLDGALRKRFLQDDELPYEKATMLATQFEAIESESRLIGNAMRHTDINAQHINESESVNVLSHQKYYQRSSTYNIQCKACGYQHAMPSLW